MSQELCGGLWISAGEEWRPRVKIPTLFRKERKRRVGHPLAIFLRAVARQGGSLNFAAAVVGDGDRGGALAGG